MSFRLFGVNVEIQLFFWLTAVLLGWRYLSEPAALAVWVAVVFVSVLVHEFGHAFAIMRHRIEPEISLHGMGGTTTWRSLLPLGRGNMVIISLAGPFAGFALAGVIYGAQRLMPGLFFKLPPLGRLAVSELLWVNFGWGVVNLLPVLPFDGGHVLEHALGPKRERLTAVISLVFGVLITVFFLWLRSLWGAMIFGLGAMRSYQRLRDASPGTDAGPARRFVPPDEGDAVAPELASLLRSARHALSEEDSGRAMKLAKQVLDGDGGTTTPSPRAVREAFEVIAWVHHLEGRPSDAAEALAQIRRMGEPDAALEGAVLRARGDARGARKVLEAARAKGDDRKEVVGPLIQILIEQGDVPRAAATAFDIVDSLSDDDARKMAEIAYEHRSFDWSARLYEAVFTRNSRPDDAYDAARALAQDGKTDRALDLLRKAVDAGFSDRTRAWSDGALEALRTGSALESILPRP